MKSSQVPGEKIQANKEQPTPVSVSYSVRFVFRRSNATSGCHRSEINRRRMYLPDGRSVAKAKYCDGSVREGFRAQHS